MKKKKNSISGKTRRLIRETFQVRPQKRGEKENICARVSNPSESKGKHVQKVVGEESAQKGRVPDRIMEEGSQEEVFKSRKKTYRVWGGKGKDWGKQINPHYAEEFQIHRRKEEGKSRCGERKNREK